MDKFSAEKKIHRTSTPFLVSLIVRLCNMTDTTEERRTHSLAAFCAPVDNIIGSYGGQNRKTISDVSKAVESYMAVHWLSVTFLHFQI